MNGGWAPLLASEWRKVATTKMAWVLAAIAVAYSSINAGVLVLVATGSIPDLPSGDANMLEDPDYITTIIGQASTAATFVLILGIIAVTGEYRHMTITSTLLSTPRRGRVLTAKMGLYGLLGALIAVITLVAVTTLVAVALLWFEHAPITASTIATVGIGSLAGFVLYAVLGVSLGALIRSQIAAIIIAMVWVLLLEAILVLALPAVAKWLPGGALSAVMDVGLEADLSGAMTQADRLPPWGGALVLLAYSVVLALFALRTTMRRDIT